MSVVVTISETVTGADCNDALSGGSTGLNLGQVVNGSYTPITAQSANTGAQEIYIRHDAVDDPITDCGFYVAQYSGTYGGADSAVNDIATLIALGGADSGATKNNTDGNSRGLHMHMDWQVSTANQFDYSYQDVQRRIFGKDSAGEDGEALGTMHGLHEDACSYWNGTSEVDATTPVAGKIGKSTDTVLGNRGHVKLRFYLEDSATEGGILQWDTVFVYSYTS